MPISERRLNLKFITEYIEKIREAREERQIVTADKPLISKPPAVHQSTDKPTYTTVAKSKK